MNPAKKSREKMSSELPNEDTSNFYLKSTLGPFTCKRKPQSFQLFLCLDVVRA